MSSLLWKLKEEKLNKTNLFLYSKFVKKKFNIDTNNDFNKLWKWSVENTTAMILAIIFFALYLVKFIVLMIISLITIGEKIQNMLPTGIYLKEVKSLQKVPIQLLINQNL